MSASERSSEKVGGSSPPAVGQVLTGGRASGVVAAREEVYRSRISIAHYGWASYSLLAVGGLC